MQQYSFPNYYLTVVIVSLNMGQSINIFPRQWAEQIIFIITFRPWIATIICILLWDRSKNNSSSHSRDRAGM